MKRFAKILSIISLCLVFAVSCKEIKREKLKRGAPYEGPQMVGTDVEVYMSDSAKPNMKMKAPKQIILENEDQDFPDGFYVEFYNSKEKVYSKLASKKAYFNKIKNEWKITGKVLVENFDEGKKLETEELFWNLETGDILVEEKHDVTITEPYQILYGKGLKAKDDFSYYKIKHPSGFTFR
jgi:LPS export ABC transporter protein LptC